MKETYVKSVQQTQVKERIGGHEKKRENKSGEANRKERGKTS